MERNHTNATRWRIATLVLAAGLMLGPAGCKHASSASSSSEPLAAPAPAPAPVAAPEQPAQPAAAAVVETIPVDAKSVFFDFDSSELKPDGRDYLSRLGSMLAKHPELHVRVEGNCDERGTVQYNVALGQRRAEAARKYLVQMGATDDQMTTVSYGKERPRATRHDESAWRENRRDDFVPDRVTVSEK